MKLGNRFKRSLYSTSRNDIPGDINKRIIKLRKLLKKYSKAYYNDSVSLIGDNDYDKLFNELKALEFQNSSLDSFTNKVGFKPSNEKFEIKHTTPMLSLSNVYTYDEILQFDARISRILNVPIHSQKYTVECKYDGIALSLLYENNQLKTILTRGSGLVGEDITESSKKFFSNNIPFKISDEYKCYKKIEIRGEAFINRSVFELINKKLAFERSKKFYSSPRNLTSSLLLHGKLACDTFEELKVEFVAYNIHAYNNNNNNFLVTKTHWETLNLLTSLGFSSGLPYRKLIHSILDLNDILNDFKIKRNYLDFDIDGIVIKLNCISNQQIIGCTSHSPKYSVAYKFSGITSTTRINQIEINVGRTGKITPTAIVEPVNIGGSIISRVTLHNKDFIDKMNLSVGSKVVLERSGDVIPKILQRLDDEDSHIASEYASSINWDRCPCPENQKLVKSEKKDIFCTYNFCPLQFSRQIIHFCKSMNIQGLGPSTLNQLIDFKIINQIPDIFRLEKSSTLLKTKNGWGDKKVENLLINISKAKEESNFENLLVAFGINGVGREVAKKIVNHFGSIEKLQNTLCEDLMQIPTIGNTVAESIYNFISDKKYIIIINELKELGLRFENKNSNNNLVFENKSFMISGKISSPRSVIEKMIEENGGRLLKTASKNANYLIKGIENQGKISSKEKIAIQNNIEIITHDQFKKMLEGEKKL